MSKVPLRILYLGDDGSHSTSMHRANALRRIGCDLEIINPQRAYAHLRIPGKINYLTGYRMVSRLVCRWLDRSTKGKHFDLVWVNGGHDISNRTVELLRERFGRVVSYMNDDPTGPRDRSNWVTYRAAIPSYDLCVVVRSESELEFEKYGAKRVFRTKMGYDEIAHAPLPPDMTTSAFLESEVAFIGTWMKGEGESGRDFFLSNLIEMEIPLTIWGDRWDKSPCWNSIRPHWRGNSIGGRDYVAAIQGAKICLGLLSKGNRDLHTQRSVEIPFAGGLLCAERTSEHLDMYQEGFEAVFWSSVEECADLCNNLLSDASRRSSIRAEGMRRVRELRLGNEDMCRRVLSELGHLKFANYRKARTLTWAS